MSIKNHNKAYRRGIILGLTLAEIMLLILFLLLLAFSAMHKNTEKKYEQQLALLKEQERHKYEQKIALKEQECEKHKREIALVSKNKAVVERIVYILNREDPDITEELVEGFESLPAISNLIRKAKLQEDKNEKIMQVILRGVEKLKIEKQIKENEGGASIEIQLQQALSEKNQLKNEVANIKGQNKNLLDKLGKNGKGIDPPPCWVDANGKAEFIYNLFLTNDGIIIRDNKLPHRAAEQAKLPISEIIYDKPISVGNFQNQTFPLFKWSKTNDCRFYVRIYDRTGGDEKRLFKLLLRTAEGTFYKVLI